MPGPAGTTEYPVTNRPPPGCIDQCQTTSSPAFKTTVLMRFVAPIPSGAGAETVRRPPTPDDEGGGGIFGNGESEPIAVPRLRMCFWLCLGSQNRSAGA